MRGRGVCLFLVTYGSAQKRFKTQRTEFSVSLPVRMVQFGERETPPPPILRLGGGSGGLMGRGGAGRKINKHSGDETGGGEEASHGQGPKLKG